MFLKDGPAIVFVLKANVTIPDVSVTPEKSIDFGAAIRTNKNHKLST